MQGDFIIRASRGSDAGIEDQSPQPVQPECQPTTSSASVGEQHQPLEQDEQPCLVSVQLMVRTDGSVKLLLLTSDAAAPASEHAPISRRDTPSPVDIPLVEVSLADPAGEHPGHGKSALSRFFHRTRKADDNKPINLQAIRARRGLSSQLARSMRDLSRSIKRSFRRRDSPPIPVGRHLSKQKGRRRASMDVVDEGVNEGQLDIAGQPDANCGVVVEFSTGASASGGHGALAVVVPAVDPAEVARIAVEPPLPISKKQYPPPPAAIHMVEVSASSAAVLGSGREAAEAAVARKYEELQRAGSWAGLVKEERGKLTGCWGCLFARQLQ
ncbi:hypothetical protein N2152v2_005330 [Parachlorella kessleri]